MSNELIEVFDIEVLPANADATQLRKIAKEKATFVVEQVRNLTQNLEKVEKLTADAKNAKDSLLSKTFDFALSNFGLIGLVAKQAGLRIGKSGAEKRSEINTEAIILQNKAITELTDLVQESIQFAATSAVLNQAMLDELSKLCNEGFIDVYGKVQEIREEEKKYLKRIENGLKANQKILQ